MNASYKLWMKWVGHVVLLKLARSPARDVQESIVERQVDVCHQWRHRAETFKQRRKFLCICRLRRNLDHFSNLPFVVLAIPKPNRSRQILERNDNTNESVRFRRI